MQIITELSFKGRVRSGVDVKTHRTARRALFSRVRRKCQVIFPDPKVQPPVWSRQHFDTVKGKAVPPILAENGIVDDTARVVERRWLVESRVVLVSAQRASAGGFGVQDGRCRARAEWARIARPYC